MNVVFCITCKGRTQHLSRTLPPNLADNPKAKFVLLDYNDQDSLAWYLKAEHAKDIASGRLCVYQYKEPVPFQMAHAKNMAHRLGILEGGDVLVNLDADNFTGVGFDDYLQDQFSDENVFLWSRMVKEGDGRLPRGISGRIAVTKDTFLLAGGYDEKYNTHSPDDKDFNARLRRLGFEGREIHPRFLLAILHNDKMRYKEYPHVAQLACDDFHIQHTTTIVNAGKVGCGTVFKNFSSEPIELRPIPTRIFGIGMHRTATTSLHLALETLGFNSAHWPSAHWAKAIWREMNQTGKSPTLERSYALSDLPLPLMFRKLDNVYKGSKFILTVRDENKWLESVRKHWNPEHNQFRAAWDTDPFSHRVHELLYGRRDFDADVFLARYRRHNAEVLEHFKDRPGDLLVMDMEKNHGFNELCAFLDVPVPDKPYPNRSHLSPQG